MDIKYVHLTDGTLLLFSKYNGLQHAEMVMLACGTGIDDVADAGFVDYFEGGFETFGKSLSTGKASTPASGTLLTEAIARGEMKIYCLRGGQEFASNREPYDADEFLAEGSIENLKRFKIV